MHTHLMLNPDGQCTLHVPKHTLDDELWEGPRPQSLDQIQNALGVDHIVEYDLGHLPSIRPGTIEFDASRVHAADPEQCAIARAIIDTRLIHDEGILQEMNVAIEATTRAHLAAKLACENHINSEAEAMALMQLEVSKSKMGMAYGPIVTTHGHVLHERGHTHALHKGDLLLVDVGAESELGVASDITRTWSVGQPMSKTQRVIHELVLRSQEAAITKAQVGVSYLDVHMAACHTMTEGLCALNILRGDPKVLVAEGVHALFFPHGIGHLLGLDVHDMEDLGDLAGYAEGRQRSKQFGLCYLRLNRDLKENMVVTIEPGFYQVPSMRHHPDFKQLWQHVNIHELEKYKDVNGIRIEDDVLITIQGPKVLSHAIPKR